MIKAQEMSFENLKEKLKAVCRAYIKDKLYIENKHSAIAERVIVIAEN